MTENNQTNSKRGGQRIGAGRKPGAATKRTREIADRAMAEGITPLEFMLKIMRQEPAETDDLKLKFAQRDLQFEAAKAAAPYIHPRLAAVEVSGADGAPLIPPIINLIRESE